MKSKGNVGIEKATESLEKAIMETYENSCPLVTPEKLVHRGGTGKWKS